MLTWQRGPREVALSMLWRILLATMILVGVLALFADR